MWLCAAANATAVISTVSYGAQGTGAALAFTLVGEAEPELRLLDGPPRVVVDFRDTVLAAEIPELPASGLVQAMRHGLAGGGRYRIVLNLSTPAIPVVETVRQSSGSVVYLRLRAASQAEFSQVMQNHPAGQAVAIQPGDADSQQFTVVVDPGHGGIDNGATGVSGVAEKDINLAFAYRLRDALHAVGGIAVVLTRTDDRFVALVERSRIARAAGADLFISIHADSIAFPRVRGATVYTLSDKATDQLARDLASSENASDRFAGVGWQQDTPEIHDILVDLMRRESEVFSVSFADLLIDTLKSGEVQMINNPHRSAGFRVLRAPDVPSVLFELGYLSNADDDRLVQQAEWQTNVAGLIARAVTQYRARQGPAFQAGER